jgi:hypothetical protein
MSAAMLLWMSNSTETLNDPKIFKCLSLPLSFDSRLLLRVGRRHGGDGCVWPGQGMYRTKKAVGNVGTS